MKWSEFRTSVIKMINNYSTSGNLIPTTDSSVVDSVLRLPQLYNSVLLEIATTAKYINSKTIITQVGLSPYISTNPKYIEYTMPSDFYSMNKVEFNFEKIKWLWRGRNKIAVSSAIDGEIDVFYYAYPTEVPETPSDDYVLQLDNEANQASVFGVAALILMDDPVGKSTSTNLMALYQNKLANMTNAVTKGSTSVSNSLFTTDNTYKLF